MAGRIRRGSKGEEELGLERCRRTERRRMLRRMLRRVEREPVEGEKRELMSVRRRDQPEDVSSRGMAEGSRTI